jgi:DNA-binding GntR family transcriptional regulator
MAEIEQLSISEQIYLHIKEQILSGALPPGQRIPEEQIAKEFGVSRTPVREAIKRLEIYGLIRVKPRSYAEVPVFDQNEMKKLVRVSNQLEKLAVLLLLESAVEVDWNALQKMAYECRDLLTAGDAPGFYKKDSQWHLELARRSGNPYLCDCLERLYARLQIGRIARGLPLKELERMLREHFLLLDCLHKMEIDRALSLVDNHAG